MPPEHLAHVGLSRVMALRVSFVYILYTKIRDAQYWHGVSFYLAVLAQQYK